MSATPVIGQWSHDQYLEQVLAFHGHTAPGVVIGGYMVEAARRALPEGILFDAVSETVQCLPDAIQLLTPCTIGNGWLRVYNLGIFALTLYDKHTGRGVRVKLDAELLRAYPDVRSWFLKEKPKKEQDSDAIARQIREGGFQMLSSAQVQIHPDILARQGKGPVTCCPECGEYYPARFGERCRLCQGNGPYEHWNK